MKKTCVTILNAQGQPVLGGTCQVKDKYSGLNVTLYEDNETTTKANPAVSDVDGFAYFKVNDGVYDLVVTNGAGSKTFPAVQISDGGDLVLLENNEAGSMAYGKLVYVTSAGKAKLATNAATELEARARFVCITRGGLAAAAIGVFKGPGRIAELTGGTAGAACWLGTAGGIITTSLDPTNPANAGKFIAPVGEYLTTLSLNFVPSQTTQI